MCKEKGRFYNVYYNKLVSKKLVYKITTTYKGKR